MIARYQVVTYEGRRRVVASPRSRFEAAKIAWGLAINEVYRKDVKVEPLHVYINEAMAA